MPLASRTQSVHGGELDLAQNAPCTNGHFCFSFFKLQEVVEQAVKSILFYDFQL
jgi:hypothetical protein